MATNDLLYLILLLLIIVSYFAIFGIGFFVGRIMGGTGVLSERSVYDNKSKSNAKKLSIDDRKVVLAVSTEGLDKKYEELGDTKESDDNISSSVNKLKSLKQ